MGNHIFRFGLGFNYHKKHTHEKQEVLCALFDTNKLCPDFHPNTYIIKQRYQESFEELIKHLVGIHKFINNLNKYVLHHISKK